MKEKIDVQMSAVRINIAFNLCMMYPRLYHKVVSKKPQYISPKEKLAFQLLKYLMKLEPCIKHILAFEYRKVEVC